MRYLAILILVTIYVTRAWSYELNYSSSGETIKWAAPQEISVTLDPSLEQLGEDTYTTVEESFLEWLDYIEEDITINFIYENCEPSAITNCIRYTDYDGHCSNEGAACAFYSWNVLTGSLINASINVYPALAKKDFKNAILHEIGHFYGLNHSENHDSIMYPYVTEETKLHQDDINGIKTLYEGKVYPSIENEPVEYHFQGCSINKRKPTKSIFSLFF